MSSFDARTAEPLTLYTSPDLRRVYDRAALLEDLALGRLPRQRADRHIAKVLPAGSQLVVEPYDDFVSHVVDCAYRPYFAKDLFAIGALLDPCDRGDPRGRAQAPPADRVLERLVSAVGTPYLFGGSAPEGSVAQEQFLVRRGLFEPRDLERPELRQIARSSGIDCSGLFNWATDYSFFGDSKDVYQRFENGLRGVPGCPDPATLARLLEPLDIVIFRGHMLLALPGGRVIQAVGDGRNAETFSRASGHGGRPFEKYNRVVIDSAEAIFVALIRIQGRTFSSSWRLDDHHFMIVRYSVAAA